MIRKQKKINLFQFQFKAFEMIQPTKKIKIYINLTGV